MKANKNTLRYINIAIEEKTTTKSAKLFELLKINNVVELNLSVINNLDISEKDEVEITYTPEQSGLVVAILENYVEDLKIRKPKDHRKIFALKKAIKSFFEDRDKKTLEV